MDFVEDNIAWPTMVRLAGCLETKVREHGLPGLCQSTVVPGPSAVMDRCAACGGTSDCQGQAWVRFVQEFPSRDFPAADTTGLCNTPMAYVLEVGLGRCLPTGSANGLGGFTPPSLDALVNATRLQMADKRAMLAAIQCCMDDGDVTYAIQGYSPIQVTGDCGGGTYLVTIWGV